MSDLTSVTADMDRLTAALNAHELEAAAALVPVIEAAIFAPDGPERTMDERQAWSVLALRFGTVAGVLYLRTGQIGQALAQFERSLQIARTAELLFYRSLALQQVGYGDEHGYHARLAEARLGFQEVLDQHGGLTAIGADAPYLARESVKHLARIMTRIGPTAALDSVLRQAVLVAPDELEFRQYLEEHQALHVPPPAEATRGRVVSRYPDQAFFEGDYAGIMQELIADSVHVPRFLSSASRFFCIGSCFAREIDIHLRKQGFTSFVTEIGETVNNSYTNLILLRYVTEGTCPDAYRQTLDAMLANAGGVEVLRERLQQADVVVFTLGVAPAFFDDDGNCVLGDGSAKAALSLSRRYRFRTTTVDENLANLRQMLTLLRGFGAPKRIILTVSPVPLRASFEYRSAIVADCVSKSTLRVVVDTLIRGGDEDLVYWPSFEMVRWVSGHRAAVFGVDDGNTAHISFKLVREIVAAFVDRFRLDPA